MRLRYFVGVTSQKQAKDRHRELATELHPDRNPENSGAFVAMQQEFEQVMMAFQLQPDLQEGHHAPRTDPPKQQGRTVSHLPAIRHTTQPPERNTLVDTAKEIGKQLVTGLAVAAIEKIVEHVNKK